MKRLLAFFLVLCALLHMTACGRDIPNGDKNEPSNAPTEEPQSPTKPREPSKGLQFTLNIDYESYSVSGIGTCTDTDVVIPSVYNHLPVTAIDYGAFWGCKSFSSVTIPDSVTTIGDSAFAYTNLMSVTIPDSVTSIGYQAFWSCDSLTTIIIPDSVIIIAGGAFGRTGITSITIPDSVTTIVDGSFSKCTSLTGVWVENDNPAYSSDQSGVLFNKRKTILINAPGAISGAYTIPDSVTTIGNSAFAECKGITAITIPNSVTSIGIAAFSYSSLTSITYAGTTEQWSRISFSNHWNEDVPVTEVVCSNGKVSLK